MKITPKRLLVLGVLQFKCGVYKLHHAMGVEKPFADDLPQRQLPHHPEGH